MATATVVGTLIGLVLADDALVALIGSRIYRDVMVEEVQLPFVEVSDKEEAPVWITKRHRIEKHHIQARVYAPAGATIGADNQAVVIADNLERVWNWDDLALPQTTPIAFERGPRAETTETRAAPDKRRVTKVELNWELTFARDLTPVAP
jgi:hypothetical protein